jgi:alkylhydroperoxidase/carboxymuconolactone decarboxylase family protein YurZ
MPRGSLPKPVQDFRKRYPDVWKAFNELGDQCHHAGPLDEKTRRLVNVALSIGAGLEGAVLPACHVRRHTQLAQGAYEVARVIRFVRSRRDPTASFPGQLVQH